MATGDKFRSLITIARTVSSRIGSDVFVYLSCSQYFRAEGGLFAERIFDCESVVQWKMICRDVVCTCFDDLVGFTDTLEYHRTYVFLWSKIFFSSRRKILKVLKIDLFAVQEYCCEHNFCIFDSSAYSFNVYSSL